MYRLRKWGGVLSTLGVIFGAVLAVLKSIAYVEELHRTIKENKLAVSNMMSANERAHTELRGSIHELTEALRDQHDRDQAVITNLRIAVAAIQAAQAVREGRVSYEGVTRSDSGATISVTEAPPSSSRVRRLQAAEADSDALEALMRAEQSQRHSPLMRLDL